MQHAQESTLDQLQHQLWNIVCQVTSDNITRGRMVSTSAWIQRGLIRCLDNPLLSHLSIYSVLDSIKWDTFFPFDMPWDCPLPNENIRDIWQGLKGLWRQESI